MMKSRLSVSLALVLVGSLVATSCRAGNGYRATTPRAREALDAAYDVEHYAIDLRLHPNDRRIDGVCRIKLLPARESLHTLDLDLVGLTVHGVEDESGRQLPFLHDGRVLTIELPEPLAEGAMTELEVRYGGRPVTGLWFSGERADGSGPTQVFSHGQAQHSSGWFPCFDQPSDRATSDVRVTMPSNWVSVAAGSRVSSEVDERAGTRTDLWSMTTPHPSYLVTLVAGELTVREADWNGVPLLFAAEPKYERWIDETFAETDEILTFLTDYTGIRYPYPKYAQTAVANFPWGGMENISATTLTPQVLKDERARRDDEPHDLICHEAAHQWFGDLFTCNSWKHLWLNEGFATYLTLLYYEETRGVDEFRARMRQAQERYVEQDRGPRRRPTVWDGYKEPEDAMDTRAYEGAAARLNLLRFVLGDEVFRSGVRSYAAEAAGRNVVTDDFKRAMEAASGRDLEQFFDEWFYGAGYPEFDVSWSYDQHRRTVRLDIRQTQSPVDGTASIFHVPVDVEIKDPSGSSIHRLDLRDRRQIVELPALGRPYYVRFDKYDRIPKRLSMERQPAELIAMSSKDDDVNGRRDAVRRLGELAEEVKTTHPDAQETYVAEIANRLTRDTSAWVREAAAEALGRAGGLEARERLIAAASSDESAKVRRAALTALCRFGVSPGLAQFGRDRFEEGYSWGTMGAAARLVCSADPANGYSWLTQKLFMDSPHDVLCASLLETLGGLSNPSVPDQLLRWARDESLAPEARATAVRQLARQPRNRVGNARALAEMLDEEDFRLRRAVVEAIAQMSDPASRSALRAYYPRARTADERRAIEAVLSGTW